MRRGIFLVALMAGLLAGGRGVVEAHVGSPNVFFEGPAGPYPVRVMIRPPDVIPGLAEITVRIETNGVNRVTVLPVRSDAGTKGAPAADTAQPVRGESNLYTAQLWLMTLGSYSVFVRLEGEHGPGQAIVPVNAMALVQRPMPRGLNIFLGGLGGLLLVLALTVIAAAAREGALAPDREVEGRDRHRGRVWALATVVALVFAMIGFRTWWRVEELQFQTRRLYKPPPIQAEIRVEEQRSVLHLDVLDDRWRGSDWVGLLPDHGKIMHLFVVREPGLDIFAHLHPLRLDSHSFVTAWPGLPGGSYRIYADVTLANGFAATLTTNFTAQISMTNAAGGVSSTTVVPDDVICTSPSRTNDGIALTRDRWLDLDDSWHLGRREGGDAAVARLEGGWEMVWKSAGPLVANRDVRLDFEIHDSSGARKPVQSYMGMAGHAAIRREDGAVFAHLHPVGSFSMASQRAFELREAGGNPPVDSRRTAGQRPVIGEAEHRAVMEDLGTDSEIHFPYAFPQAGAYRIWVQARVEGRVLTGVFDVAVAGP